MKRNFSCLKHLPQLKNNEAFIALNESKIISVLKLKIDCEFKMYQMEFNSKLNRNIEKNFPTLIHIYINVHIVLLWEHKWSI